MEQPQPNGLNIAVKQATEEDFLYLKRQVRNKRGELEVKPDNWVSDTTGAPIINEGASVCAIVYAYSSANNEMVSGHFMMSEIFSKPEEMETVAGYDSDKQEWWFRMTADYIQHFPRYQSMLARIRDLSEQYKAENIEAHIFGQNFLTLPTAIGDGLINRSRLVFDLNRYGVPKVRTADHRSARFYNDSDHTLYLPSEKTIYHYQPLLHTS